MHSLEIKQDNTVPRLKATYQIYNGMSPPTNSFYTVRETSHRYCNHDKYTDLNTNIFACFSCGYVANNQLPRLELKADAFLCARQGRAG